MSDGDKYIAISESEEKSAVSIDWLHHFYIAAGIYIQGPPLQLRLQRHDNHERERSGKNPFVLFPEIFY